MEKENKLILNAKIYYAPIYCCRHFPSSNDIYEYIIDGLIRDYNKHKIVLYTSKREARKAAEKMLCDDDCCTVAAFDFTCGYVQCYLVEDDPRQYAIRPSLDRWSDVYEIKDKEE